MALNEFTIGGTSPDYASISAWESDRQTAGSSGDTERGKCRAVTFDEHVLLSGWTSGVIIELVADAGAEHGGTEGSGPIINPSTSGHCIEHSTNNDFLCDGLEFTGVVASSDEGIRFAIVTSATLRIRNCLFYDMNDATDMDGVYSFANSSSTTTTINIERCAFRNIRRASVHAQSGQNLVYKIRNCTFAEYGFSGTKPFSMIAVRADNETFLNQADVFNCLIQSSGTGGTVDKFNNNAGEVINLTNCILSDAKGTADADTLTNVTENVTFQDDTSGTGNRVMLVDITDPGFDFHLINDAGNLALDYGDGDDAPSNGLDWEGDSVATTGTANVDAGVDEFATAGPVNLAVNPSVGVTVATAFAGTAVSLFASASTSAATSPTINQAAPAVSVPSAAVTSSSTSPEVDQTVGVTPAQAVSSSTSPTLSATKVLTVVPASATSVATQTTVDVVLIVPTAVGTAAAPAPTISVLGSVSIPAAPASAASTSPQVSQTVDVSAATASTTGIDTIPVVEQGLSIVPSNASSAAVSPAEVDQAVLPNISSATSAAVSPVINQADQTDLAVSPAVAVTAASQHISTGLEVSSASATASSTSPQVDQTVSIPAASSSSSATTPILGSGKSADISGAVALSVATVVDVDQLQSLGSVQAISSALSPAIGTASGIDISPAIASSQSTTPQVNQSVVVGPANAQGISRSLFVGEGQGNLVSPASVAGVATAIQVNQTVSVSPSVSSTSATDGIGITLSVGSASAVGSATTPSLFEGAFVAAPTASTSSVALSPSIARTAILVAKAVASSVSNGPSVQVTISLGAASATGGVTGPAVITALVISPSAASTSATSLILHRSIPIDPAASSAIATSTGVDGLIIVNPATVTAGGTSPPVTALPDVIRIIAAASGSSAATSPTLFGKGPPLSFQELSIHKIPRKKGGQLHRPLPVPSARRWPQLFDQRKWLERLMTDGLSWFGLRSMDLSRRCSCVSDDGKVDPTCQRCMQLGYLFTDYLIKGYLWVGAKGFEHRASYGPIATDTINFIGLYDRAIKRWDLLLDLDTPIETEAPRQPLTIMRSYIVTSANAVRGNSGRVEFYRCFLEERALSDYRPGP